MKKVFSILLIITMLFVLSSCNKEMTEAEKEALDITYMDSAETWGIKLVADKADDIDYLKDDLYSDGLWYNPVKDTLTNKQPKKGYGNGTAEDGNQDGNNVWGYYSGFSQGTVDISYYDNKKDYTKMAIKLVYDEGNKTLTYDWYDVE